jgi:hypothetical protein
LLENEPSATVAEVVVGIVPVEETESQKERAARERNTARILEADRRDEATLADSTVFQDITAAQRSFILDHAGFANRRIVLDSKQEAGHETVDRV